MNKVVCLSLLCWITATPLEAFSNEEFTPINELSTFDVESVDTSYDKILGDVTQYKVLNFAETDHVRYKYVSSNDLGFAPSKDAGPRTLIVDGNTLIGFQNDTTWFGYDIASDCSLTPKFSLPLNNLSLDAGNRVTLVPLVFFQTPAGLMALIDVRTGSSPRGSLKCVLAGNANLGAGERVDLRGVRNELTDRLEQYFDRVLVRKSNERREILFWVHIAQYFSYDWTKIDSTADRLLALHKLDWGSGTLFSPFPEVVQDGVLFPDGTLLNLLTQDSLRFSELDRLYNGGYSIENLVKLGDDTYLLIQYPDTPPRRFDDSFPFETLPKTDVTIIRFLKRNVPTFVLATAPDIPEHITPHTTLNVFSETDFFLQNMRILRSISGQYFQPSRICDRFLEFSIEADGVVTPEISPQTLRNLVDARAMQKISQLITYKILPNDYGLFDMVAGLHNDSFTLQFLSILAEARRFQVVWKENPLFGAIERGDKREVEMLLSFPFGLLSVASNEGVRPYPLVWALMENQVEIARFLVSKGANPDGKVLNNGSPGEDISTKESTLKYRGFLGNAWTYAQTEAVKKFLEDYQVAKVVYVDEHTRLNDSEVRLRESPDLNGAILKKLQKDTNVKVDMMTAQNMTIGGKSFPWVHVTDSTGASGWVYGQFVSLFDVWVLSLDH